MDLLTDIAERALMTFLQAFLAVWLVSDWADLGDVDLAKRAAVAGLAAALAVLKGAIASRIGDKDSAALYPSK